MNIVIRADCNCLRSQTGASRDSCLRLMGEKSVSDFRAAESSGRGQDIKEGKMYMGETADLLIRRSNLTRFRVRRKHREDI